MTVADLSYVELEVTSFIEVMLTEEGTKLYQQYVHQLFCTDNGSNQTNSIVIANDFIVLNSTGDGWTKFELAEFMMAFGPGVFTRSPEEAPFSKIRVKVSR